MVWGLTQTRIALAVAGLGLAAWAVNEHVAHVKAETTAQATEAANKVSLQVIAQHDAANKALLDAALKASQAQIDALSKTVAALKTPQQQVQWSQEQLAAALKGITIQLDSKGQAVATIPAATVPQLPQVIEKCQTCELNLSAATQKLTYAEQQHADDIQKILLANQNAENWKKASKGTFWDKMKHDGKVGLIGGAVVVVALCVTGHCPK